MNSSVAFCFIAFTVVLVFNIIFPVDGQCTVHGCDNYDSSNNIVDQMRELNSQLDTIMTRLEAVDRRSLGQDASLHQLKNQQDTVLARLRAVDQRSQDQAQSNHEFLNASLQEMKTQQDTVLARLEAAERRSQKQYQSIREFLNASFPQLKDDQCRVQTSLQEKLERFSEVFNASFQRMENRHDIVVTNLEAVDQSIKNQTQLSWRLATGLQAVKTQQDTAMNSLQAIELHLQGQDLYIQSLGELLNASLQQTALCLDGQEISTKNQTQISWTQAPGNASGIFNWIVIMHRFNGSVDFHRNWTEYRNGFGNKERGDFWLGNEEVHRLTNRFPCTLRVEVQLGRSGEWYYAEYSSFSLDSESNKYKLHLSGYSGNAGDTLTNSTDRSTNMYLGGMNFSTWDNDNDRYSGVNCASGWRGGWWFNHYARACLTCYYQTAFYWHLGSGWQTSGLLRAARMMIRSR